MSFSGTKCPQGLPTKKRVAPSRRANRSRAKRACDESHKTKLHTAALHSSQAAYGLALFSKAEISVCECHTKMTSLIALSDQSESNPARKNAAILRSLHGEMPISISAAIGVIRDRAHCVREVVTTAGRCVSAFGCLEYPVKHILSQSQSRSDRKWEYTNTQQKVCREHKA